MAPVWEEVHRRRAFLIPDHRRQTKTAPRVNPPRLATAAAFNQRLRRATRISEVRAAAIVAA